jgi:two-component system CheB/CheR fusion protein
LVLDAGLRVVFANQSFYDFFKVLTQETEHRLIYELGNRQFDITGLKRVLEEILPQNTVFQDFEVDRDFPGLGRRVLILNGRRLQQESGPDLILLAMQDITSQKEMAETFKESERKLQALNVDLMSAQESERQSVSLALHEDLAQNLVALKFKLRFLENDLPPDSKAKAELEAALRSIDGLVEGARGLSWGLRPQVLDLGLNPAIQHLVDQFQQYFRINADIKAPELDRSFNSQSQVVIYRVLQEALVNVVKHAQASRVSLKIGHQDNRVQFQVADNGVGFQVSQRVGIDAGRDPQPSSAKAWLVGGVPFQVTPNGKGFKAMPEAAGAETGARMGLLLMESRIRMLGGDIAITSKKDQGTQVTFAVPTDGPPAA